MMPRTAITTAATTHSSSVTNPPNIAAGVVMTTIRLATLFFGVPAPYYAFFSAIEIATTAFILWYAVELD